MKNIFNMRKSKQMLFCLLAMILGGVSTVWAQDEPTAKSLPYSYGFEDYNLSTDGWTTANPSEKNSGEFAIVGAAKKTGSYGFRFSSYSTSGENTQYLISPEFDAPNGIILSFWYAASSTSGTETFKVGYSTTDTEIESFTFGDEISTKSTSWSEYTKTFPAGTKYVAVYYYANYQYRLYVDDFAFTAPEVFDGPALKVYDGEDAIATTGYSYNFGLATAGAKKTFTLSNPGTESVTVNVAATGGFSVSPATATIAAGDEATLTITMPETSASGVVTITPTAGDLDAFTINVSGTLRDADKLYEDDFSSLPEDWSTNGTWSYSSTNGAYTTVWYLSSNARLITPKLVFTEGETIFVEAKGYSTSNTSYQHLQMQYSADGSSWTNFDAEPVLDPSQWNTFAFTGVPAGSYYIAINASQANVRMFYGGELPKEPKMVVTQPASLDFGAISEAATKTFTIANTGRATLSGITITSSNSAVFAISGAPTSLEAGASQEVTITMSANQTGAQSSEITVSATDMEDVKFTVTGAVIPADLPKEEFTNGLPEHWTNSGWTFTNGIATAKSSSTMTTPKLVFAEGGLLVIKIKNYDTDATNSITIKGSTDNGTTWSYNKQIQSANFLSNTDWTTLVISDIPSNVNKIQLVGFYCIVDEIAGLYYAPDLAVTKDGETVSSPASYDFGENLTADATVTFCLANVGAGTLNITNVAISGDGAAAYSTNWTQSVAAPFDLNITRTYDGTRTGVQEAVVTVTTDGGNFVVNVTGSDRGLNAPEMSIDLGTLDFGRLAANDTKTVTVTNVGTGSMTVDISSDNTLFVVSPAQLTEIGEGESKTFTVTFDYDNVAGNYGAKNANITVTPTYDETADFAISAMAYAKDPNVWSEDFADADIENRGWTMDTGWIVTDGKAVGGGSYYLTTPYLIVTGESDELAFDFEITSNYTYIYYYISKDGGDWSNYYLVGDQYYSSGETGSFTITGLAAGTYQFRFRGGNYKLDNFEGFLRFIPEHDAEITAENIPSTGYVGREYTATVTVKEKAGKDETATAKLLIAGNEVATEEVALTANGETEITLTFTPEEAVSNQTAQVVVTYTDVELKSTSKNVTIKEVTVFDEAENNTVTAGSMIAVQLKRQFIAGWNTLCLPFDITSPATVFGDGVKAYTLTSYSAETGLEFTSVNLSNGLDAGVPYLLYVPAAITEDLFFESVTTSAIMHNAEKGVVTFQGTYNPMAAGSLTGSYVLTNQAKIAKAGANASLKAFRAYFTTTDEARMSIRFDGGTTTGIGAITTDGEMEIGEMYNLQGQKVQGAQKGLYIINGKKIVRK